MDSVRIVFCSCPESDAPRLAQALVDERLAACVSLLPGTRSVYRWQGAVVHAEEALLLVKTTQARLETLVARLQELHPHELPEVIAVEASGGLPAYLGWIAAETSPEPLPESPT